MNGDKMIIRLGYVALSKTLDNVTSSKTITYTNYSKEPNQNKIDLLIQNNLSNLEKILNYNVKNNIHFYRLTSKLIPLATHPKLNFDYINKFRKQYDQLSKIIHENKMRVDFHPDQFTVLNSTNQTVITNTFKILEYHYNLLKALNITNQIIILHVGSNVFGKQNSLTRFINNFNKLSNEIKRTIAIENDDKIFNIEDVLKLSKIIQVPVVLDYHHHVCNYIKYDIDYYLPEIIKSWNSKTPKIHFSSPKSKLKKDFRSHSEYIDIEAFINFIEKLKKYQIDIDIMIEAKGKDEALFRLVRQLKYRTNYKFIDETSFEI